MNFLLCFLHVFHLSSVVRQGEGRPSKPSLDYPPPAASDGCDDFFLGGGKVEVLPLKVDDDLQMIDVHQTYDS